MTFRERLMLACTGLLFAACAIVLVRASTQHVPPERQLPADEVPVDWTARYPFAETPAAPSAHESRLQRKERQFHATAGRFEVWTNQRLPAYQHLVEAMQAYQEALGWNIPVYSDFYSAARVTPDGLLTDFLLKKDVSPFVDHVAMLSDFCEKNGIRLLVAVTPGKIAHEDAYDGTLDFSNENGDAFLAGLQERGIDCLDLRPVTDAQPGSRSELFFRTDHHWRPGTARAAAAALLEALDARFGYQADVSLLDADWYTETLYPARHLGSYGRRFTLARTQPDDFPLLFPDFPTSFHVQIPSMALDRTGDFSILYDPHPLEGAADPYGAYLYATYTYGDRALISIRNQQRSDGRKLLLLHDSFCSPMTPFLALGMEELDVMDLRYFTGSLRTYLQQERPDTVVLCYTVSEFNWYMSYPRNIFRFD